MTILKRQVQAAIKELNGERTPGPNDIPVFFYRDFWDLVWLDVIVTLEELHQENQGMENINKSYLFRVPKRQGAKKVENFYLISIPLHLSYYCKGVSNLYLSDATS